MVQCLEATIQRQRRSGARSRRAHAPVCCCAPPPVCVCVSMNWWERRGAATEARRRGPTLNGTACKQTQHTAWLHRRDWRTRAGFVLRITDARDKVSSILPFIISTCPGASSSLSRVCVERSGLPHLLGSCNASVESVSSLQNVCIWDLPRAVLKPHI